MASVLLCTTMGWACATRLAQAFAACGARVEALAPPGHPLQGCVSRFYPHRAWQGAARWRQVLALSAPDLAVPCDERAVRLLAGLEGAERFLGRRPSYPVLFGRAGFLQAAERLGPPLW